jgi:hypothetical protein
MKAALRANMRIVPVYPPVETAFMGEDHSIWVQFAATPTVPRHWVTFDSRGNPVGHLVLPPRALMGVASMEKVWLFERDANDVWSVVRYGVRR